VVEADNNQEGSKNNMPTFTNLPVLPDGTTPPPNMGGGDGGGRIIGSTSFLTVISIIIGIVIGTGMIVGVLGRAFFVPKDDYVATEMKAILERGKETSELKQTLERLTQSLARQEEAMGAWKAAFDKLSAIVETMRYDMPRGRGR
jgi:hypothetical protein